MTKPTTILFVSIILTIVFTIPVDEKTIPEIPVIFEDHWYTLHAVDRHGKYYYVEDRKLHRYSPEIQSWEMDLFYYFSSIRVVHVTVNNYIFVGYGDGAIYRSIDGGNNFTLTYKWKTGGHCHAEWSITSDDHWILIGEYGLKIAPRKVCASNDWGDTWTIVYETPESEGVHIHRVAIDPYTNNWWITVGDIPVGRRVLYSSDNGIHWNKVECPKTGRLWQPFQPANILFFEKYILLINEPLPQVFRVERKTMKLEYIADIINLPNPGLAPPYSVVAGVYGLYASIVRYPEHTHDAGIFVSYDEGYTWLRLINFTDWAIKDAPWIKPSRVFGAIPIIYVDGYIHAKWTNEWGKMDISRDLDSGRAFKFKDAYYVPEIQKFDITWENTTNLVAIHSNSIVTHFNFDQVLGQISFNVSGDFNALGYCNLTIPKDFLKTGLWIITIDNVPTTDFIQIENKTHNFLYFTYT
ncbi:MAG: WD40/YVTN/BNR-like repeat-containing protein, partial [Candidatus Hodarchaeota archaeon]